MGKVELTCGLLPQSLPLTLASRSIIGEQLWCFNNDIDVDNNAIDNNNVDNNDIDNNGIDNHIDNNNVDNNDIDNNNVDNNDIDKSEFGFEVNKWWAALITMF